MVPGPTTVRRPWLGRRSDTTATSTPPTTTASPTSTLPPTCITSSNDDHVVAGRAYQSAGYAYALGSNQNLGLDNTFYTATLKQSSPGYWERCRAGSVELAGALGQHATGVDVLGEPGQSGQGDVLAPRPVGHAGDAEALQGREVEGARDGDDGELLRPQLLDEPAHGRFVELAGDEERRGAGVEIGAAPLHGVGEHVGRVAVAGLDVGVGAGVEDEGDAGPLTGGDGSLDGPDGVRQRLHLVLEVGADDADVDGAGHRLARVAVAGLEVGRDRQVDGGGDAADGLDHEIARDLLAVGVAVGRCDRVARRGERLRAGGVGDDAGRDDVPDVDDEQQLGVAVQALELLGLGSGVHLGSSRSWCSTSWTYPDATGHRRPRSRLASRRDRVVRVRRSLGCPLRSRAHPADARPRAFRHLRGARARRARPRRRFRGRARG